MHLRSAPLAVALLLGAAAVSGAQANPYAIQTQATNQTHIGQPVPQQTCVGDFDSGPASSPLINSYARCDASYAGGTFGLQAGAAVNHNGFISTSAFANGVLNQYTNARAQGIGYIWNFYTISNPANVFRIALETSLTSAAIGNRGQSDDIRASGLMVLAGVDPTTAGLSTLRSVERLSGAGQSSALDDQTRQCSSIGQCTVATTASDIMHIELFGSSLNSNGIFAALLQSSVYVSTVNNVVSPVTTDLAAYAYFRAPTVTLYDVDGNDVTAQHTITQDLVTADVVATPEPASVALLATGLIGVFGVSRRRRHAA